MDNHNTKEELWKDVKGYEGIYQVSDQGRIKSLERCIYISRGEGYWRKEKERILKPHLHNDGYLRTCLSYNGKMKRFYIHVLVAKAFVNNEENKPEVNHLDGNKENNKHDNLEWVTRQENILHSVYHLGNKKENNSPVDSYRIKQVKNGKIVASYPSIMEAERNGYDQSFISRVLDTNKKAYGYHWKKI